MIMDDNHTFFVIIGVLFILAASVTAFYSTITLVTIIRYWNPHCRSIANLLTCNTCVTFLFFDVAIAIQIPSLFQSNQSENNPISSGYCRFRGLFFLIACLAKTSSYLTQAISRYFITILHRRRILINFRMNRILIISSWIYSFGFGCLMLVSPVAFQYEPESHLCVLTSKVFHTSFTLMAIAFIIPVNVIIALYGIILWRTTRASRIQPDNNPQRNNNRNIQVFQKILILVLIVVIGGSPYLLATIINAFKPIPWPWYSISIWFIVLASATESVVLFYSNKEIQAVISLKLARYQMNNAQAFTLRQTWKSVSPTKGTTSFPMAPVIVT